MLISIAAIARQDQKLNRIAQLEEWITKAKTSYYNKGTYARVNGRPVTDEIYDAWEDELRALKPKSKALTTRSKTTGRKAKVKLPFWLGSLTKVREGEKFFALWRAKYKGPWVISAKLDGYSILIEWDAQTKTHTMYTAGDDDGYGLNISHLASVLGVPAPRTSYIVRAELIIPHSLFAKYGSKDFENPRNAVASIATRTTPHAIASKAHIVAHDLLSQRLPPSKMFAKLKSLGFLVPVHKTVTTLDESLLVRQLEALKKNSKYECDGLVIAQDKAFPNPKSGDPASVVAFKLSRNAGMQQVKVTGVTWEASKLGRLSPTIQIEPTRIGGVTVTNFTGHNAFYIQHGYVLKDRKKFAGKADRPLGPGAIVNVVRSGDVIPYITEVVKPARKPDFPKDYTWDARQVNIMSNDAGDHAVSRLKLLTEFFRVIGVENLDIGIVTKMVDFGLDNVTKITKAVPARLMKIPGIQERMATKIYKNIQQKIKDVPLHVLMAASGMFGRGFGTRKIKPVLDKYPRLLNVKPTRATLVSKLLEVDGYSTKSAEAFADALPKFVKWVAANPQITYTVPRKTSITASGPLVGQHVVFTGFRDKPLEALIEKAGGTVGSGVSSNTSILLVSNLSDNSTKAQKARSLGLPLMTADQFRRKYKL